MAWPQVGQPVAVVYPPDAAARALADVAAAGADAVLGFGVIPSLVVARSDQPDFIAKLYQSGALVVLRAPAKADCLR